MAWIKSEQALASHPKVHLLAKDLGISVPQAVGHLHLLWWWALDYADDGDLTRYRDFIPSASQWAGDEELFINSLIKHNWIDEVNGKLVIHDWLDYTGALIETREKDAERKRKYRQSKNAKTSANRDTWESSTEKDTTNPSGASAGRPEDIPSPSAVEKTRLEKTRQEESISNSKELQPTVNDGKTSHKTVFTALCRVLEYDTNGLTASSRGQLNKASKELAEVGATPHDIEVRARNFALSFGWKPTPTALVKHWASMSTPQPKLSPEELNKLQTSMRTASSLTEWADDDNIEK
tara:strand:+ start:2649 stop:3530 length:882 start_codon:yes stop_codon:yes gene_type:complete